MELLLTGQAMVYEGSKAFEQQHEFQAAELTARSGQVGMWGLKSKGAEPTPTKPAFGTPALHGTQLATLLVVVIVCAALVFVRQRRRR